MDASLHRDDIAIHSASDSIDKVQEATARDMAVRRIESNFARVQTIRLALERIEDGSYGLCLRCDGEIGPKRLKAVPWAAYCLRCQDLIDRSRARPEAQFEGPFPIGDVA